MSEERARTDMDLRSDAELRADWAALNFLLPSVSSDPEGRDGSAWWVPLMTTLGLLILAPVAYGFAGLSVMATDSCGPDDCSAQLTHTLDAIFVALPVGWLVSLGSLIACWALPWKPRNQTRRRWAATLAVAPQLLVILMVLTLPQG
ncbi:hypothetical protein ACFQVC_13030 [Streptomyces monticola]|uniref:Uncharacterized protein n=1 Tax=Streptomyces monticola TaxID=2666263 RepID=A0ABW2JGJ0_9ACTN